MAEEIDLAGLIRTGDRVAWSAGPVELAQLLRTLDNQLDRVPRFSILLNLSLENSIDAKRLAARSHVVALCGAGTNRRSRYWCTRCATEQLFRLPDLVASGQLSIEVVLLQLAADGDTFNFSLMVNHLADAVFGAQTIVAEINNLLPVTYGDTRVEPEHVDHVISVLRKPFEVIARPALAIEKEIASHVSR
jgi:acyl-CoA hydrolase